MPTPPSKRSPLLHLGHPDGGHIPFFEWPREAARVVSHRNVLLFAVLGIGLAFLGQWLEHIGEHARAPEVSLPWVLPFVLLLGCIAAMPFIAKHLWERHYHHVAMALGAIVAVYYIFFLHAPAQGGATPGFFQARAGGAIAEKFAEYISFIFLLASLFIVSGGIVISVRRRATPAVNAGLLLTGAILANIFGTTGAAMLLIRPYLRINKGHIRPYHILFFIFIVANCGGSLTPIGDPPLFLGYLKGVPFWWVLEHCWPMWLLTVGALLAIFLVIDLLAQRNEKRAPHDADDLGPAVSIYGISNLLLIFAILAGVLLHGKLVNLVHIPWRELIMVGAVALSLWSTPHKLHELNVFNFAPIKEVAFLFVGIFATMVPALNYLANHAHDPALQNALHTPGQFYFLSGTLSAVLDNAPTYLTFLETLIGRQPTPEIGFLLGDERLNRFLIAISLGSVFFGAMTYIGNGPNFMVKSIAENAGVKCPSFFGYIFLYALPILLPVLVLVWAIFLRTG